MGSFEVGARKEGNSLENYYDYKRTTSLQNMLPCNDRLLLLML